MPAHGTYHAPRQLVLKIRSIKRLRPPHRQSLRLGQAGEVTVDLFQRLVINTNRVTERAQVCDDPLRQGIRSAIGGPTRGTLKNTHTMFWCLHVGMFGEPDGAMTVQLQRLGTDDCLDRRNQRSRPDWRKQPPRILDVKSVDVRGRRELARG